jgi:hypothetical protein
LPLGGGNQTRILPEQPREINGAYPSRVRISHRVRDRGTEVLTPGEPMRNQRQAPANVEVERPRVTQAGGGTLDPTPPPDHEGFIEARAVGLRALRARLAKRRKK